MNALLVDSGDVLWWQTYFVVTNREFPERESGEFSDAFTRVLVVCEQFPSIFDCHVFAEERMSAHCTRKELSFTFTRPFIM
jgi:hypothetical protein